MTATQKFRLETLERLYKTRGLDRRQQTEYNRLTDFQTREVDNLASQLQRRFATHNTQA